MRRIITAAALSAGLMGGGVAMADTRGNMRGEHRVEQRESRGEIRGERRETRGEIRGERRETRGEIRGERRYEPMQERRVRPERRFERHEERRGYRWISGDWTWNGYEWVWIPGHYVRGWR